MGKLQFSLEDMMALSWDWRKSVLLVQAHSTGIFDALDDEFKQVGDVANLLGSDPRATYLLLVGLAGLGVVEKVGEKFRNGPTAVKYLVSSSPHYRGDLLRHDQRAMENWRKIPDVLISGKPIAKPEVNQEEKIAWQEVFAKAMEAVSEPKVDHLFNILEPKDGQKFLDIGCGPGTYMFEFADRLPGFSAVLFDRPETSGLLEKRIRSRGMEDRMTCLGGDLLDHEFTGSFDGVLISQILHIFPSDICADLARRASEVVKTGGFLAIQEMVLGPDENPGPTGLFGVQMMLGTAAGTVYTPSEVARFMTDAQLVIEKIESTDEKSKVFIGRKRVTA